MSNEDNRATALALAIQHFQIGEGTILEQATRYADFIINGLKVGDAPVVEEVKKTRGRPARGEVGGVATPAPAVPGSATTTAVETAASITPSEDPFAEAPAAPVATMAEVRAAILALRDATDQTTALAVLKKYGADNFGALAEANYGNVVRDAKAALPTTGADPFAEPATPATAAVANTAKSETKLTIENVKDAIVKGQKRTSTDKVQQVVVAHGGVGAGAGGVVGPSLKNLPADQYAAVIAAIAALPTTK
jgi:hypothetical protein